MTPFAHQALFERCRHIVRALKIDDAFGEIYLPSVGDVFARQSKVHRRKYRCIEHTFHELSHAALIGLPLATARLSSAIGETLGNMPPDGSRDNEVGAFAAVTALLDAHGIAYDREDIIDQLYMQVSSCYSWSAIESRRTTVAPAVAAVTEFVRDGDLHARRRAPVRRVMRFDDHRLRLVLSCGHTRHPPCDRDNGAPLPTPSRCACHSCLVTAGATA